MSPVWKHPPKHSALDNQVSTALTRVPLKLNSYFRLAPTHTVTFLTNGDINSPMTVQVELDLMLISEKGSAIKNGLRSEYVRLRPQESYPAATFLNTITAISWFVIASDFWACCSIRSSTTERILSPRKIEPILVSSDPNFRPTDIEIGGDGALYVSDWANAIVGHMQHNMRDPKS